MSDKRHYVTYVATYRWMPPGHPGQRARFYALSDEGQLRYAQRVARYLCFLAETTGLCKPEVAARALAKLETYTRYADLLADIAPG